MRYSIGYLALGYTSSWYKIFSWYKILVFVNSRKKIRPRTDLSACADVILSDTYLITTNKILSLADHHEIWHIRCQGYGKNIEKKVENEKVLFQVH